MFVVRRVVGIVSKNGAFLTTINRRSYTKLNRERKFNDRSQLKYAKRLVVKLGSAVITREDEFGIALGRLASIVEQVAQCQVEGRECIMVTSGAVAFGKQKLTQELLMSLSMRETLQPKDHNRTDASTVLEPRAAAAIGQSGLMSLYEAMFSQYGVKIAQILVTELDFTNTETRQNLISTLSELINLNIIPVINTNDAVTPPPITDEMRRSGTIGLKGIRIEDNDSLAAMVAAEMQADLLILISDVDGIFNKPPREEGARFLSTCSTDHLKSIEFGKKSKSGTGGMDSKVKSALWALDKGTGVVICNGMEDKAVKSILEGRKIGTFFTNFNDAADFVDIEILAETVRNSSRQLQILSPAERADCISKLADSLLVNQEEILKANEKDLNEAKQLNLSKPLLSRLTLTANKLNDLAQGLKIIAKDSCKMIGKCLKKTKIAENLILEQITVPIGVLLVIFESRPDSLPQVAALSIATGNGLLLKGGKEATQSNKFLMSLVKKVLETYGIQDSIALVSTRDEISDLLSMDHCIDLVIPRGSKELVKTIQNQSKSIPVLGHSEGICHVYVDKDADLQKAIRIVIDSKCDYPAACNAAETILIHESLVSHGGSFFLDLCHELKSRNVHIYSGPKLANSLTFSPPMAKSLKHEYGSLECCIELVPDLEAAIWHIHKYGSSHTDVIVTENEKIAKEFLEKVDSACVFHNASTRFADGFRFGLGAEVGISTSRIHARGPVGAEGLLTTKWILRGVGQVLSDFGENGSYQWVHESVF